MPSHDLLVSILISTFAQRFIMISYSYYNFSCSETDTTYMT